MCLNCYKSRYICVSYDSLVQDHICDLYLVLIFLFIITHLLNVMYIRYQILWLIHTLYYVGIVHGTVLGINDAESCDLLCKECNGSRVFADDSCKCNFFDNNDKGVECIRRIQGEIQTIDLNTLSENLTDEERGIRSILKSRRRLKMGDAEKVAQYFINGGPVTGHSHFIKAFTTAYDSIDAATNSFSGIEFDENNPENEFYGEKSLDDTISWNTFNSSLYMIPDGSCNPAMSGVEAPIVEMVDPALGYTINQLYDAINPLVGSIIHPYKYKYGLPLYHTSHRTNSFPAQILHNLFGHHRESYHPVHHGGFLGSSNDRIPISSSQSSDENNNSSNVSKNLSRARSNNGKSVHQNIGASFLQSVEPTYYSKQIPYIFSANAIYQPMQYRRFNVPYQYTYHNPLINVLHPVSDEYIVQPEYIPHYIHDISDPLISASNPNSYCANNANAEQKDKVSTNKIINSNNEVEQSDPTKNNIAKEENKTEK